MPLKVYVSVVKGMYDIKSTSHQYSDLLEDDLQEGIFNNINLLKDSLENGALISEKVKTINFLGYNHKKHICSGKLNDWTISFYFSVLLSVHSTLNEPKIKRHIYSRAFFEIVENWFRSMKLGEVAQVKDASLESFIAHTSYYYL